MSNQPLLHIIYLDSGMVLSKKHYPGWREIQDEFVDFKTSLGPWPVAEVVNFLRTEYPSRPPFTPEQVTRFLESSEETLVSL